MKPTEHRAIAEELLAEAEQSERINASVTYQRIEAHAVLARSRGAGSHYDQADRLLEVRPGRQYDDERFARALAHALLADA